MLRGSIAARSTTMWQCRPIGIRRRSESDQVAIRNVAANHQLLPARLARHFEPVAAPFAGSAWAAGPLGHDAPPMFSHRAFQIDQWHLERFGNTGPYRVTPTPTPSARKAQKASQIGLSLIWDAARLANEGRVFSEFTPAGHPARSSSLLGSWVAGFARCWACPEP
jgi:hypothetical protein